LHWSRFPTTATYPGGRTRQFSVRPEEVSDLREGWMKHADAVLADEEIVAVVYEALAKRYPKSRYRGRRGAPADMVLRLLIIKHIRN
jgi:transposase, IS5 family